MGVLKSVYEESNKIGHTVDTLVALETSLSEGIAELAETMVCKEGDYARQVKEVEQRMKKIEQALRI